MSLIKKELPVTSDDQLTAGPDKNRSENFEEIKQRKIEEIELYTQGNSFECLGKEDLKYLCTLSDDNASRIESWISGCDIQSVKDFLFSLKENAKKNHDNATALKLAKVLLPKIDDDVRKRGNKRLIDLKNFLYGFDFFNNKEEEENPYSYLLMLKWAYELPLPENFKQYDYTQDTIVDFLNELLLISIKAQEHYVFLMLLHFNKESKFININRAVFLYEAIRSRKERLVSLLLDLGCDPNAKMNGEPHLYTACRTQDLLIFGTLLERGANPYQLNESMQDLSLLALAQGSREIQQCLELYKKDRPSTHLSAADSMPTEEEMKKNKGLQDNPSEIHNLSKDSKNSEENEKNQSLKGDEDKKPDSSDDSISDENSDNVNKKDLDSVLFSALNDKGRLKWNAFGYRPTITEEAKNTFIKNFGQFDFNQSDISSELGSALENIASYGAKLETEISDVTIKGEKLKALINKRNHLINLIKIVLTQDNLITEDSLKVVKKAYLKLEQEDVNRGTGLYRLYSFFKSKSYFDNKNKERYVKSTTGELAWNLFNAIEQEVKKEDAQKESSQAF